MNDVAQAANAIYAQFQAMILENRLEIVDKHIIRGARGGLYYVNTYNKKVYLKAYQKRQCETPGLSVKGALSTGFPCTA